MASQSAKTDFARTILAKWLIILGVVSLLWLVTSAILVAIGYELGWSSAALVGLLSVPKYLTLIRLSIKNPDGFWPGLKYGLVVDVVFLGLFLLGLWFAFYAGAVAGLGMIALAIIAPIPIFIMTANTYEKFIFRKAKQ